jgi:LPXTG-motif cell wall-anchored protein
VQLTSSPRRALGLVAVGALGMSTAVLGVTGTASAAPSWEAPYTFSTDPSAEVDHAGVDYIEIQADPFADCTVAFVLDGAGGGAGVDADGSEPGAKGGRITGESSAIDGDAFDLFAGTKGGNGVDGIPGAAGENAYGYDGTPGYTDMVDVWGGGGGGASTVARAGDSPILGAFGGDGAFSDLGAGVGGGDNENLNHVDGVDGTPTNTGAGVISGTVTCVTADPVAPGAPALDAFVDAGDGTAKFWFTPGSYGRDSSEQQVESTYEYQLDGGAWKPFTAGNTGSDELTGTLTGLTNMKKYSLSVRATSAAGASAASAPVTFTPFRPTAAPASVSASVGIASVRISWTPPADAAGVVDYVAFAVPEGAQSDGELVACETTGTACTVAVKAGRAYSYGVASRDALRNEGGRTFGEKPTAVVPASAISATVPKSDGTLTADLTGGKAVAGQQVTISGKDFLPGSSVDLVVYSTPVKLGTAVVLADGTFSATVTLPKDLANGTHHLVASGVDANGNARNLVVEVTVSGGTAVLANTGFSALPVAGAGALALLAGGGLLFAARRRNAA